MMEELGLLQLAEHSNSNIIVSCRDHNKLLNIRNSNSKVTVSSGTTPTVKYGSCRDITNNNGVFDRIRRENYG